MINAIVINNATANRATVIATRTESAEMGMMKAMLIDTLKVKLANGIAHFVFKRKMAHFVRHGEQHNGTSPMQKQTVEE